ncbi:MAG: DNA/RNA non-specific endonuclease, partial [Bacteroidales bacterium]|nr:DNA/RNA non-specific endonuclease [Bacteroidales bacterium]
SNQQTFYMTNVTPQNQAFNESGWLTLENKVRSWAFASDTLYVVSGCVVSDKSKTIRDNNGRSVPVPDAYYKVLLRYSKSSTFGFSGYSAAAFYLEHEHNRVTLTNEHMMSVDELEKKLGMDFFVNLPDDIENKVEQQNPKNITWWSVN